MPRKNDIGIKRAALYARVSTEEQAMHGLSLDAQRERLTEYARENRYQIVDYYVDEGVSARKRYTKREQFMRMLSDVEQGKIDLILFIKLDRWFRNIADYYEVQRILDKYHVDWIATEESYDTTTANGRFALNIKLAVAQDEADRTSERIKFVFSNMVKDGRVISGSTPLGYKIVDKRFAIDEEERPIVEDIFRRYLAVRSSGQTMRYIQEVHGKFIGQKEIKHILSNRVYIGENYGIPNWCPPIIDEETFNRAQELLKERAERYVEGRTDRVYYFTGLLFCSECGHRMSTYSTTSMANGRGKRFIYYRCPGRYQKRCSMPIQINQKHLESWLLDHLDDAAIEHNAYVQQYAKRRPPKKIDESAIMERINKLKDLYLSDLLPREMYEVEYNKCQAKLREAKEQQNAQPPKPIDLGKFRDVMSTYSTLSEEGKKAFWSLIVKRIDVTPNGDYIVDLNYQL